MIVQSLPANPEAQATYALDNPPGAGTRFMQGLASGLETTSLGLVLSGDALTEASLGAPMSESEWSESEWFRPGLQYTQGMTRDTAEILAHRKDRNEARAFAAQQAGWWGSITSFAGEFIGSIPDPMNFLPLVGPAWRAKAVAKLGAVGGAAVAGSLEAATGAAILQPFLAAEMQAHQDPYDFEMAASNILIAAGIGGTFGAGTAWLGRVKTVDKVAATSAAVAQVMDGRPVDVQGVQRVQPGVDVAPDAMKVLHDDYRVTLDQIAEIEKQIEAAPDMSTKVALEDAQNALSRKADDLEGQIVDASKPDMTVAPRDPVVLPEVDPTTKANAYQPVAADEVDFSIVDRRYQELEAAGLLDADDIKSSADALAVEKETINNWSKAIDLAANCLLKG